MQENMKKKKNAGRNAMSSAASTAFLRWAADSEWVTQRALMLWPGTRNWKNRKIHGLVEERKLREMNLKEKVKEKNQEMRRTRKREPGIPGDVWGKRYALGSEGRQFLRERNPKRYYTELKENDVSYEIRKVYRMSLMSETRAMAELAGYTTHRQLKPPVTRLSLYDVDETAAGKPPAWRVFDEIPAVDTEKYRGEENSIYNQGVYQYYTEPQRGRTYKLTMDTKQYLYRETPVGCLYFLPELQELSRIETTLRKGTPEESDLISYTRMSAAIFTGSGLYLVYNTERTAPTINRRGEELAEALATNWAQAVYQRSITELQNDYEGKVREVKVSPKVEGRLFAGRRYIQGSAECASNDPGFHHALPHHTKGAGAGQQHLQPARLPQHILPPCDPGIDPVAGYNEFPALDRIHEGHGVENRAGCGGAWGDL